MTVRGLQIIRQSLPVEIKRGASNVEGTHLAVGGAAEYVDLSERRRSSNAKNADGHAETSQTRQWGVVDLVARSIGLGAATRCRWSGVT